MRCKGSVESMPVLSKDSPMCYPVGRDRWAFSRQRWLESNSLPTAFATSRITPPRSHAMHVLFVAPHFPANQRQFVKALAAAGARVTGIGEPAPEHLDSDLRSSMVGYEQVRSVCDVQALYATVRKIQKRSWVDRLESTVEAHVLAAAEVREATKIPGLSLEQATLCRDKPLMKSFLRKAGIPTAASTGADTFEEARAFAKEVGFPLILKPRAAAGAEGTRKVGSFDELDAGLRAFGLAEGRSVALEEFIEGHEGFYDTLTVGGEIVYDFASHYYPNVLEAMRTRWIAPIIAITNRVDHAPGYRELRSMGHNVISAIKLGTTASHMEWFFGAKGLKFSEIGARPPGVRTWDLYGAANGVDLYREWANAIVHGRVSAPLSREFSAGLVALRPDRDGRITHYDGAEAIQRRFGQWIIDAHLPNPGTPTQPVEAGYHANAWVRMRHPDYDTLRAMLEEVGRTLKVYAR